MAVAVVSEPARIWKSASVSHCRCVRPWRTKEPWVWVSVFKSVS
jgi:hypothetical protein